MLLRPSTDTDVAAITAIYAHYVEESSASFEIEAPDETEMGNRRLTILAHGLPFIVSEVDGIVAGYAYAGLYRPRRAYRFTVEDSIYINAAFVGKGIGRGLLSAVIEDCERKGYRQMVAVIGGSDNQASIGLHQALGFEHVGLLPGVGYKFGRWADSVFMQKALGAGASTHPDEVTTR